MRSLHRPLLFAIAAAFAAVGFVGSAESSTIDRFMDDGWNVVIDDDTVSVELTLPGGIEADLELVFEDAVGLSESALGLGVALIDPLDPDLLSRLPDDSLIPIGFPMMLRIEPPPAGPLAFSGIYSISLHTHDLTYTPGSPLRLMRAPLGGTFRDITAWMGLGSYRVRGSEGGFSEFLIVTDLRDLDDVIVLKFDALQDLLDELAILMDGDAASDLQQVLDDALAAYGGGDLVQSIEDVETFEATVVVNSPVNIPDTWLSNRSLRNASGELRGSALTLRSSLVMRSNEVLP